MVAVTVKSVVCYAVVFSVAAINCALITDSNFQLWKQHKKRNQGFVCGEPKPRSFKAFNLFSDLSGLDVDPIETVLYRCDDSAGCCMDKFQECKVQGPPEIVDLVFLLFANQTFVVRKAENHTSCSCQTTNDTIK